MTRSFKQNFILSALLGAAGLLLPFLAELGGLEATLLTMQFVVLVGGFLLPVRWSVALAAALPILNAALFGYPPLLPDLPLVVCQTIAYAAFLHMLYGISKWKKYPSLLVTLLMGGLVYFSAAAIMAAVSDGFNALYYTAGQIAAGWPGLLLQIGLVPAVATLAEMAVGNVESRL